MRTTTILLFAVLFVATAGTASAQSVRYKIIVNASNPVSTASRAEASKLFLKKSSKWQHGAKVQPVDQKTSSSTRASFSKSVLGKSVSAVKAFWQQQMFSGRATPPPEKSSDAAVLAYVRGRAGAIGYVSLGADTSGVKVLVVSN